MTQIYAVPRARAAYLTYPWVCKRAQLLSYPADLHGELANGGCQVSLSDICTTARLLGSGFTVAMGLESVSHWGTPRVAYADVTLSASRDMKHDASSLKRNAKCVEGTVSTNEKTPFCPKTEHQN